MIGVSLGVVDFMQRRSLLLSPSQVSVEAFRPKWVVCGGYERKRRREPGGVRGVSGRHSEGGAGEASVLWSRVPVELNRPVAVGGEGGVSDVSQGRVRRR